MAKKKKKAKKLGSENWPTQHLVLWRTTLDDVPLLLTPDRALAFRYADRVNQRDVEAGHKVMGIDVCSAVNVTVVSFRKGRPYKMRVVRETIEWQDEAETPTREPAKKRR